MYKTNRVNHDFQIAYFLAGACHTPDAAYALMCDLKEDRSNALKMQKAAQKREQAKVMKLNELLKRCQDDEASRLEVEADLDEIEALRETTERNVAAAIAELATIERCMAKLEPLRKYAHLPLAEAHQAAQQEEWRLELITRAENYILTTGTVPPDHFNAMRLHPEFKTSIVKHIAGIRETVRSGDFLQAANALPQIASFDVPKMLELESQTVEKTE